MTENNEVVLIGAGNVATHLGLALKRAGFSIRQVYSRTEDSAQKLSSLLHAQPIVDIKDLNPDAENYFFSLTDSALPEILPKMPDSSGIFLHTSGSIPLEIFSPYHSRSGVFYPLQTFSKNKEIDFKKIPVFIEANNEQDLQFIEKLASKLSNTVVPLSSEKRKQLHLAAVFACNFVNHLYDKASQIVEKEGILREFLLPLIEETADKVKILHPSDAQTGPAVRFDKEIIEKHLDLLKENPQDQEIYRLLSNSIFASKR